MNSLKFFLPVLFGLLVVAVVACDNAVPAASPNDTVSSNDPTPTAGPVKTPDTDAPERIEVPAPIDSVTINVAESFPPQYFVHIVSGLPNGCAQYNGYEMDRSNETISIDVTNTVPISDEPIACTEIYGSHEENINLGSGFDGGSTYTVIVNDVTETFVAQGSAVDSAGEPKRVTEPAPIRDARIDVNTNGPDHLVVTSGLLDSCHEFAEYFAERYESEITVDILNYRNDMEYAQMSAADASYITAQRILDVECAEIYSTVETEIEIGDDLEACKVYTVEINGDTRSIQAIAPNVRCANPNPGPSQPTDTNGRVAVIAPIEIAQVISTRSIPPQHTLVVTSGLNNGCAEFGDYEVERQGNEIRVTVTNTVPTATDICTLQYRTVDTRISLGSDFETGDYVVVINGEATAKFSHIAPSRPGTDRDGVAPVPAPIDDIVVISTRSIPPQHTLVITSGLPNGCAEFDSYAIAQDGYNLRVRVTNTEPTGEAVCTDDYRAVETRVDLGRDFETGTYTVYVNDTETTFTHIALPTPPAGSTTIVLAPIENVTVQAVGTEYVATVTSGLPNGCTRFDAYTVSRDGNTINVKVTNTVPTDPQIMCTMVYGLVKTMVPLGSNFQIDTTYVVDVNGKQTTFTPGAASSSSTREVEAPVISISINAAESYPVQYFAEVESGLPGSCVLFDRYEEARTNDVIEISVYNREPTDQNGCINVHGSHVSNIPLGISFEPGKKYTVVANGETASFVAEGTAPSKPDEARFGTPFDLTLGQTARVGIVKLKFDQVLEDSRCPANVVCVWAGRARIQVAVTTETGFPTPVELGFEGVREDIALQMVGRYAIRLEALNPYPGTTGNSKPEIVATLRVIDTKPNEPPLNVLFTLSIGKPVNVGDARLEFTEILEDSRCPANVVCIQQGRARIQLNVDFDGAGDKPVELVLDDARGDLSIQTVRGYLIRLFALDPYPGTTTDENQEPVATLTVFDGTPGEPELELRAEPDSDNPRTVRLVANIVGGADNSRDLYCGGFEWSFGDGTPGIAAMPGCIPWSPEVTVPREFEMTHSYEKAGTYEPTFSYGPLGPMSVKVEIK